MKRVFSYNLLQSGHDDDSYLTFCQKSEEEDRMDEVKRFLVIHVHYHKALYFSIENYCNPANFADSKNSV